MGVENKSKLVKWLEAQPQVEITKRLIDEHRVVHNVGQRQSTRGSAIAEEPRDALRQLKYYGRFLTELLTRSSANPEEPCEHTVS